MHSKFTEIPRLLLEINFPIIKFKVLECSLEDCLSFRGWGSKHPTLISVFLLKVNCLEHSHFGVQVFLAYSYL